MRRDHSDGPHRVNADLPHGGYLDNALSRAADGH
jgi:hypothetical protein